METFLYIIYAIIAIGALWVFYLTCDKTCLNVVLNLIRQETNIIVGNAEYFGTWIFLEKL